MRVHIDRNTNGPLIYAYAFVICRHAYNTTKTLEEMEKLAESEQRAMDNIKAKVRQKSGGV